MIFAVVVGFVQVVEELLVCIFTQCTYDERIISLVFAKQYESFRRYLHEERSKKTKHIYGTIPFWYVCEGPSHVRMPYAFAARQILLGNRSANLTCAYFSVRWGETQPPTGIDCAYFSVRWGETQPPTGIDSIFLSSLYFCVFWQHE